MAGNPAEIRFRSTWGLFEAMYKYKDKIPPNPKYSDMPTGTQQRVRTVTKAMLKMISGNDAIVLISDLLGSKSVAKLKPFNKVYQYLSISI